MALVRRVDRSSAKFYAYLSTGNFHEDTAKVYSDVGLFTSDPRITNEVSRIFSFLETHKFPNRAFEHLLVGQYNLKTELLNLIQMEIDAVKSGKKAEIILKMNSLQDPQMISELYRASQNGVHIKLIIRGICSLVPGVIGFSENIEGISIVDRYLEHARIFVFHNEGDPKVFISSADWMVRNLNHRIETTIPIYDTELKMNLIDLLRIQLNDNIKARIIEDSRANLFKMGKIDLVTRSQNESYYYLKRMLENQLNIQKESIKNNP